MQGMRRMVTSITSPEGLSVSFNQELVIVMEAIKSAEMGDFELHEDSDFTASDVGRRNSIVAHLVVCVYEVVAAVELEKESGEVESLFAKMNKVEALLDRDVTKSGEYLLLARSLLYF